VLAATTLLAALSRGLLTTLLARLVLAAAAVLAAATVLSAALLAGFLFTRVHNNSFVGPPPR
jgi:hypothetical protein